MGIELSGGDRNEDSSLKTHLRLYQQPALHFDRRLGSLQKTFPQPSLTPTLFSPALSAQGQLRWVSTGVRLAGVYIHGRGPAAGRARGNMSDGGGG